MPSSRASTGSLVDCDGGQETTEYLQGKDWPGRSAGDQRCVCLVSNLGRVAFWVKCVTPTCDVSWSISE